MDRSDDRFDEMRRAWIATPQGWSTIQRRRAEQLGRTVRARQRAVATAVPDPHDDTLIPPLWLRTAKSPASQVELLGGVAGARSSPRRVVRRVVLKRVVTRLIPGTLRAFPIATLVWAGAVLGLPIVLLYDPAPTFGQIVLTPWLCFRWPRYRWWPACTAWPRVGLRCRDRNSGGR